MVGESVGESVETAPHSSLGSFHGFDQNIDFDRFLRSHISGLALTAPRLRFPPKTVTWGRPRTRV